MIFSGAVDERVNFVWGKKMASGMPGSPAGSQVENLSAGSEVDQPGDAQAMQNMVSVQVVDILSGDHIDLLVPVFVKGAQLNQLLLLPLCELGEIL